MMHFAHLSTLILESSGPATVPILCTPCANSAGRLSAAPAQFRSLQPNPAPRAHTAAAFIPALISIHHISFPKENSTVAQFLCNWPTSSKRVQSLHFAP